MASADLFSGQTADGLADAFDVPAAELGAFSRPRSPAKAWRGLNLQWAYDVLLPGIGRRMACPQRAQDVLHDAFVRYATRAQGVSQPQAYLRRVADHVLIDHVRESARYVPQPEHEAAPELQAVHAAEALSPEQLVDLHQRLQAIQTLIDTLPPRAREVFWLFRIEGYRQREIAEQLGISLNMVERHVMRALIDLRRIRASLES